MITGTAFLLLNCLISYYTISVSSTTISFFLFVIASNAGNYTATLANSATSCIATDVSTIPAFFAGRSSCH